jgi:hypothetical protein
MSTNLQVARTIQDQIGNRALYMIGAKDFLADETSLKFRVGRNEKSVTHVKIVLLNDQYEVYFLRQRRFEVKIVSMASDVYADGLRRVIESHTGLRTSL